MASIVKRGNSFCVVYSCVAENDEKKQKWETSADQAGWHAERE